MTTEWFAIEDAKIPEFKLVVETGPSGMKLFIYRPSRPDDPTDCAKFWFKSKADVERFIDALAWIKEIDPWPSS